MPNVGTQAISSGDFGESYVTYLLAKEGLEVVRAKTVGFDLFAIDTKGKLLSTRKMIGISVKARISKSNKKFVPSIPMGSRKVKKAQKTWGIDAWIAAVVGHCNNEFDVFLFPFSLLDKFKGKTTRKDVLSTAVLKHTSNPRVIRLLRNKTKT